MECRMMVAGDLFEKSTQDPTFLKKIITGDESFFRLRPGDEDAVIKVAPNVVSPTKEITPRQIQRRNYAHCIWCIMSFVPPVTVCCWYFLRASSTEVARCSPEEAARQVAGAVVSASPSHTSLVVQQFLAERNIHVITQPPYSPDLAASDFWLFPTLKMGLKGTRFTTTEDIKLNTTAELRKLPKEAFRRCSQQWQHQWSKCVCTQGSYFEGD
jgi:hypothetical protein